MKINQKKMTSFSFKALTFIVVDLKNDNTVLLDKLNRINKL